MSINWRFQFSKTKAAKIAIQTVKTLIDESSIIKKVIFNVFDDENLAIYQKSLLNEKKKIKMIFSFLLHN